MIFMKTCIIDNSWAVRSNYVIKYETFVDISMISFDNHYQYRRNNFVVFRKSKK